MSAKNDITGDSIRTKVSNQRAYAAGWDRIFGNNKKATRSRPSKKKGVGKANSKSV